MNAATDPHGLVEVRLTPAPGLGDLTGACRPPGFVWLCRCGANGEAEGPPTADRIRHEHGRHVTEATLEDLYRCGACGESTSPEVLDALDGLCHDCLLLDASDA